MRNVLTIGSALVDIFIHSDNFQFEDQSEYTLVCQKVGDKLEVDSLVVRTGGGAGNTAVGFQRLGFTAALIAETGRDSFANIVIDELKREKVHPGFLIREKKEQTGGSVILVGPDGGRTALVHRGAASQLDPSDISVEAVSSAHWIHLSSIGGRLATLQTIFSMAKHYRVPLSWNPGKGELKVLADGTLDLENSPIEILLLNQQEWESVATVHSKLKSLINQIVITDGSRGGKVLQRTGAEVPYIAQPVSSIDDTGAGDAFGVGYVGAHLYGKSIEEAIVWGKKNAEAVVQQVGAKTGLLKIEQIK